MRRTLLTLAAVTLAVPTAGAQRRMTFDDVLAMKTVSDAQISPDGRWVAYVVTRLDMKENASDADVWLVSASGEAAPIRLTTSKKSDASPRWSPDGRTLAFISAREEKAQLFLINPNGGEAERLTESKSGVRAFQWSPDGKSIAFVADQELTPDEEKRQKDKDDAITVDRDFKFARLWVLDVASRKARLLRTGDLVVSDPQWSPDGRTIAYVATLTPKADDGQLSDIYLVAAADSAATPRRLRDNAGPDVAPRWSPDGASIAFLAADSGKVRQSQLMVLPAAGGAARTVATGFLYGFGPVTWSPDARTLWFTAPVRTTTQLFAVPAAGGAPRQVTSVQGTLAGATFSRDLKTMATVHGSAQQPSDVHVARLGAATVSLERRTDHNPQVRELALGRSEVVTWKSADGMEVEGLLLYPVGYERGKRYPLLTMVHGGPSGVYSQSFPASAGNFGHVWASNGWAVFYPNFRGSSAYGEKFLQANIKDWGGGDFRDIQSGIDSLVARGIADPARLAQSGWSYGGYMTAWTLTQTNRFKAVMVGAGLTDMYSMHSTNDLPGTVEAYFGAAPWDDVELYRARSAMTFIKQARTPTLILHGQQDQRVPIGQAQQLYMGLKKNGVPVELVFFPREGHGIAEPRHQLEKMRREYGWITKWTLGEGAVQAGGSVVP